MDSTEMNKFRSNKGTMTKGSEKNGDVSSMLHKTGPNVGSGKNRLSSRIRTRSSVGSLSDELSATNDAVIGGNVSLPPPPAVEESQDGIQTRRKRRMSEFSKDFQPDYRRHPFSRRQKKLLKRKNKHSGFNGGVVKKTVFDDSADDVNDDDDDDDHHQVTDAAVESHPKHNRVVSTKHATVSRTRNSCGRNKEKVFDGDVCETGETELHKSVKVNGTASPDCNSDVKSRVSKLVDEDGRLEQSHSTCVGNSDSKCEKTSFSSYPVSKVSRDDLSASTKTLLDTKGDDDDDTGSVSTFLPKTKNGATKALRRMSVPSAKDNDKKLHRRRTKPVRKSVSCYQSDSDNVDATSGCDIASTVGGKNPDANGMLFPEECDAKDARTSVSKTETNKRSKSADLVVDENSQSALLSNDGDSRDSVDHKARNDSDSCSASITSGDGHRPGSRGSRTKEQRSRIEFLVGAKVEARDCMNMWYPSKIIQVDWEEREVLIHFERWNSRFDEWVSMDSPRLRAPMRCSARKDKTEHNYRVHQGFRVGEVILARWADCKMYPAKILKIFPDSSYNVVFYDGFERVVQSINVKKLPTEMIGRINFKNVPPPPPPAPLSPPLPQVVEKRKRLSSSRSTDSAKNKVAVKRTLSSDKVESKPQSRQKPQTPTVATSNHSRGNNTGMVNKRRKLVIGGIFQAKRHQLLGKTDGTGRRRRRDKQSSLRQKTSNSSEKSSEIKKSGGNVRVSDVSPSDASSVGPPEESPTVQIARKEFIIEEDHNHFKCPMDGCNKSFRKSSLLTSHIKHYHRDVTKRSFPSQKSASSGHVNNVKAVDEPKAANAETQVKSEQPSVAAEAAMQPPPKPTPPKMEGDMDRKLITEKRRQLLLQKRLELMYQKRQQQVLLERNRLEMLEKSRQAKKARLSEAQNQQQQQEKSEGDCETLVVPVPDKSVVDSQSKASKKKRNKSTASRSGHEGNNSRRRKPEDGTKAAAPSFKVKFSDVPSSDSVLKGGGGGYPVGSVHDGRMFKSGASRKRKFEPVDTDTSDSSSTSSTTVTTSSSSDQNDVVREKHVRQKLTKEFKQFNRNRQAVRTFREWKESGREEVVNCRCQLQEEEGLMMQCEVCLSWQHGTCFNIEDEGKVPENYVCFACENARGMRRSSKYRHHQDWFKRGELASFKLRTHADAWKRKADVLRTHDLVSQMLAINQVLYSLRYKLKVVKEKDMSGELASWAKLSSCPEEEEEETAQPLRCEDVKEGVTATTSSCGASQNSETSVAAADPIGTESSTLEQTDDWSFCDHSYSAPRTNDGNGRAENGGSGQAIIFDDDTCLEPEIEGIQVTVSTSSPTPDVCCETSSSAKLEAETTTTTLEVTSQKKQLQVEPGNVLSDGSGDRAKGSSSSSSRSADRDLTTDAVLDIEPSSESKPDAPEEDSGIGESGASGQKEEASEGGGGGSCPHHHRVEERETKESRVYECQLNLLDHIDELQSDMDKRMDKISEYLESLESAYDCSSFPAAADPLIEMPRVKRLLKSMAADLNKVRRMSLYC